MFILNLKISFLRFLLQLLKLICQDLLILQAEDADVLFKVGAHLVDFVELFVDCFGFAERDWEDVSESR